MAAPGSRSAFTRQLFHCLYVDVGSLPEMAVGCVCAGLSDALALAASARGSPRIPALGLAAAGPRKPKQLFTLRTLKGNHGVLSSAISDLVELARSGSEGPMDAACAGMCVEQAVGQFRAFETRAGLDGSADWHHLQITFVTRQASSQLVKPLEEATKSLREAGSLVRIQVVTLETVLPRAPAVLVDSGSDRSSPAALSEGSRGSPDDAFGGMVDALTLRGNQYDLAGFFKSWLHDHSTDKEHLWLTLPPDPGTGSKVTILCDVSEPHLNPGSFLFGDHFFLSVDPLVSHGLLTAQAKHTNGSQLGIPELESFQLVRTGGVCESSVFGIPLRLQPTSCWKVDWTELEVNRQRFQALTRVLLEKDCVLVVRRGQTLHREAPRRSGSLRAFFGVFASESSLLVKSLTTSELLMPPPAGAQADGDSLPDEVDDLVGACLGSLPALDALDPTKLESGLCEALRTCLTNSRGCAAAKAPGFRSAAELVR